MESIRESLDLIQICVAQPQITLDELARILAWKEGLKRSQDQKRNKVADLLRSMINAGIPLPTQIVAQLADRGEPKYRFDEVAFAVAPVRLQLTWKTFKDQHEIGYDFVCIDEADSGVSSEVVDYGSISIADIVIHSGSAPKFVTTLDLYVIGQAISPKLAEIMESMHSEEPNHGYRPIAWHNVFWEICDRYEALFLKLDEREPFCETVQVLANYICSNYCEAKAVSRPTISRRRTRLHDACEQLVHERVLEYMGTTP